MNPLAIIALDVVIFCAMVWCANESRKEKWGCLYQLACLAAASAALAIVLRVLLLSTELLIMLTKGANNG